MRRTVHCHQACQLVSYLFPILYRIIISIRCAKCTAGAKSNGYLCQMYVDFSNILVVFVVHRWICRLFLNLTAWNPQKPIANYVATVCICVFWSLISFFLRNEANCFTLKAPLKPLGVFVHVVFFSWNNNNICGCRFGSFTVLFKSCIFMVNMNLNETILPSIYIVSRLFLIFAIVN